MQSFSILPATADDCFDCAQLLAEQLKEHGIEGSAERLIPVLKDAVADRGRSLLILARADGRVVGAAYLTIILSVEHCGRVAWLEELYVTPDYRNRGIGSVMIAEVLERARELGIAAIDLEIISGHERAASLYQRFGFRHLDRSRWVKKLKE